MTQENTIDINIEFTFNDKIYITYFSHTVEHAVEEATKEILEDLEFAETFDIYSGAKSTATNALETCEDIQCAIENHINDSAFEFEAVTYRIIRNEQPLLDKDRDLFRDENGNYDFEMWCKYFNKNLTKVHAYIAGGKKYDVTNNIKMQY